MKNLLYGILLIGICVGLGITIMVAILSLVCTPTPSAGNGITLGAIVGAILATKEEGSLKE